MEHVLSREDAQLVDGLRTRDEAAFAELMRMYGVGMLRVARMYMSSRAVAEEVVQDAWFGVVVYIASLAAAPLATVRALSAPA